MKSYVVTNWAYLTCYDSSGGTHNMCIGGIGDICINHVCHEVESEVSMVPDDTQGIS